jgi:hypothetical protein
MEYLFIRRLEKHPPNVLANKLIMTELGLFVADDLRLDSPSLGCSISHQLRYTVVSLVFVFVFCCNAYHDIIDPERRTSMLPHPQCVRLSTIHDSEGSPQNCCRAPLQCGQPPLHLTLYPQSWDIRCGLGRRNCLRYLTLAGCCT